MNLTKLIKITPVLLSAVLFYQCSSEKAENTDKKPAEVPAEVKMAYIDSDSLYTNYNFAKDVNEASQRSQSKLESARQQKAAEIQRFAASMEQKYKNNQYLTEQSFNADQQKLQQMQADAERYMVNLQNTLGTEMGQSTKQLQDSINKCVKEYAKEHNISVVLDKSQTWYVNNIPNITNDIVKILNTRYTKVAESK